MPKDTATPEQVAKEDVVLAEASDGVEVKKAKLDVGNMAGGVSKNVSGMMETFTDAEKRKHFMSHEDMEPHRMLVFLLGLTVLITIVVALVSSFLS